LWGCSTSTWGCDAAALASSISGLSDIDLTLGSQQGGIDIADMTDVRTDHETVAVVNASPDIIEVIKEIGTEPVHFGWGTSLVEAYVDFVRGTP